MKNLVASHTRNINLKPGEVVVSRKPVLVTTLLGSCVAVTMFSAKSGFAAICHAMPPENIGRGQDLRYVDTALQFIYDKTDEYDVGNDLVVKLFGGAHVLEVGDTSSDRQSVGEQNVAKAKIVLASLGLVVTASDTGGLKGRRLFFCTRSGDVYLRHMRH